MQFHHEVRTSIPLQLVNSEDHKQILHKQIDNDREHPESGGTSMYCALHDAICTLQSNNVTDSSWIVCLTDGASNKVRYTEFEKELRKSSPNLHLIIVGINLPQRYQDHIRQLCTKFSQEDSKGCFIPTEADADAIENAFGAVASRIPVSLTFELDGKLTDGECLSFMEKYFPNFIEKDDMLLKTVWIKFLFRRVKIFDENNEFNFNDRYESLGSSLMKVMLREVENLLGQRHNKSWTKQRHEQLIYDFRNQNTPEFRLVCTAPNLLDDETKNKFMSLDLPGFSIPSINDLEKRATLDRFLSQALQVPMEKAPDGSERLVCIDDNSFVLTLDFTIKLLCLHERVTCGIPCIIEGETGVSKTALTNMYSILINSSVQAVAKLETERDLKAILSHLQGKGLINENFDEHVTVHERLKMILTGTSKNTIYDDTELGQIMFHLLNKSIRSRDSIF